MPRLSDERYRQIVDDYLSGMTQKETGEKNGIGDESVGAILRRFGIPVRGYTGPRLGNRKWVWDFEFFSRRNDPVVAYWAGFMMADGNVSRIGKNSSCLTVFIRDYDEDHLRQFLDDVGLSHESIYRYDMGVADNPHVGVKLNHENLMEDLEYWGIVPDKTHNFVEPQISDEMLPHYLRGWIDGDGTLAYSVAVVGNTDAIVWFDVAMRRIGFEGNAVFTNKETYTVLKYYAEYTTQITKLLQVRESYHMERKWKPYVRPTKKLNS